MAAEIWSWLAAPEHRALLTLWLEGYPLVGGARRPVAGFAAATVEDWLAVLAAAQPPTERDTATGRARRAAVLAMLRGALLDLLATGEVERTTVAVRSQLAFG